MSNAHYWKNKDERKLQAREHTKEVAKGYAEEILSSIHRSEIYREKQSSVGKGTPEFIVTSNDTVTEIFKQDYVRAVALNFASYKNPGGGFLVGSSAQEESLCMSSYLYNVLREFPDFYAYNNSHLNRGLYTDAAIYTPSVLFFKGQSIKYCDVLTCASPNKSLSLKYGNFSQEENSKVLENRVEFIKSIIDNSGVNTAILGAWGCGVFQQDPYEVALLFKKIFEKSNLKKVVFAVPATRHSKENHEAFVNVFSSME